jgi:hypothetical protein
MRCSDGRLTVPSGVWPTLGFIWMYTTPPPPPPTRGRIKRNGSLRRFLAATTKPKNDVDFEQCALTLGLDCLYIGASSPIAPQWRHGQTLVARACPLGTARAASADGCGCVLHWKRSWLRAHVCVRAGMDAPCVKTKARVCVRTSGFRHTQKDTRQSSTICHSIQHSTNKICWLSFSHRLDHADDDDWNVVGGGFEIVQLQSQNSPVGPPKWGRLEGSFCSGSAQSGIDGRAMKWVWITCSR